MCSTSCARSCPGGRNAPYGASGADPRQRAILIGLIAACDDRRHVRVRAMLLDDAYGIDPGSLEIIPHGVPDLPLADPETIKPTLGLEGLDVILSFGLMGPGKGYELAIDALPAVVAARPNACYAIVGATHPDLLRRDGEAYRESLVARVARSAWSTTSGSSTATSAASNSPAGSRPPTSSSPRTRTSTRSSRARSPTRWARGGRSSRRRTCTRPSSSAGGAGVLVPPGSPAGLAAAPDRDPRDDGLRAGLGRARLRAQPPHGVVGGGGRLRPPAPPRRDGRPDGDARTLRSPR